MTTLVAAIAARLRNVPQALALLLTTAGIVDLCSALTPALSRRLLLIQEVVGSDAVRASRTATVLAGLCLLMLARSIARRQRRGAALALFALAASALLNLLKGLDVEEASFSILVAWVLWRARAQFVVGTLPISWRGAAARSAWMAGLIVLYSEVGALLLGRNVRVVLTFGSTARPVPFPLAAFIGLWTDSPTVVYLDRQGAWFHHSVRVLVLLGALYALYRLLRPLIPLAPAGQDERRRARDLVQRHGRDALCYFHLRRDRCYLFAPDGEGMVSYIIHGNVALLGGDPVAAPGCLDTLARYAVETLTAQGFAPCVVGASAPAMHAYRRAGLHAIKLGEEAIIDLTSFQTARLAKRVRRAARHIAALGVELRAGCMESLDPELTAQCAEVSRSWLEQHGKQEQGFSMTSGPLPDRHDRDHQLVLAVQPGMDGAAGKVLGFITLVPIPALRGLSLDHMRRLPDAPNGLMEALIIGAAEHFGALGYTALSLNFAALCDKEHPEGEAVAWRTLRGAIFEHARHLPLRSLWSFNKKFDPIWSCRYWLYPGPGSLPATAYATIRAEVSTPMLLPSPLSAALRQR